jgi:hypothetical protein
MAVLKEENASHHVNVMILFLAMLLSDEIEITFLLANTGNWLVIDGMVMMNCNRLGLRKELAEPF